MTGAYRKDKDHICLQTHDKKEEGKRYRLNLQAKRDILKLTDRLCRRKRQRKNGGRLPETLSEQHFFRIVTVSPTLYNSRINKAEKKYGPCSKEELKWNAHFHL